MLIASGHRPYAPTNITAFFAEGEATSTLAAGLPACLVSLQAGPFLELYNVDTGFVAGRHGQFDNRPGMGRLIATNVVWNTTAYPVLRTRYTGLYRCRTDTTNSRAAYQLNVRCKFSSSINIMVNDLFIYFFFRPQRL